jgi:hypothetical protein
VAVVAIGGAVYLVGQVVPAAAVAAALVIIVSLKGTAPPGRWDPAGTNNLLAARAQADSARQLRRGHGPVSASPDAGTEKLNLK